MPRARRSTYPHPGGAMKNDGYVKLVLTVIAVAP